MGDKTWFKIDISWRVRGSSKYVNYLLGDMTPSVLDVKKRTRMQPTTLNTMAVLDLEQVIMFKI
jgi:hypothetical protein